MKKLILKSSVLTIMVMAINFIFKIYMSYKYPKETIGVFYTFLDLVTIGITLFSGFRDALVVAFDRSDYRKTLFWYRRIFAIITTAILILELLYYFTSYFTYPTVFLIAIFLANSYMVYLSYLNTSQKQYKTMLFENLVMSIGLIIGFFLVSLYFDDIYALFAAYIVSYSSRIIYLKVFSEMSISEEKSGLSEAIDFLKNSALSSAMYFFSGFFISASGIVFLYFYSDKELLADYQVVARSIFFALVAIFVYPLNRYTFPYISKYIANNDTFEIVRIEKKLVVYLLVFAAVLFFSTLFTKPIIGLIYPDTYAYSYKMLNLMLPFLPFIAYTTFALNIIKGADRFDLAMYVRMAGSIFFFLTFFFLYKLSVDPKMTLVLSLDVAFLSMFLFSIYFRLKVLS